MYFFQHLYDDSVMIKNANNFLEAFFLPLGPIIAQSSPDRSRPLTSLRIVLTSEIQFRNYSMYTRNAKKSISLNLGPYHSNNFGTANLIKVPPIIAVEKTVLCFMQPHWKFLCYDVSRTPLKAIIRKFKRVLIIPEFFISKIFFLSI